MAACNILRGIECRARCAGERVCANKLALVMRVEASLAIAATRNSSGRCASFCVRKRKPAAISVRSRMFYFMKFAICIIILILLIVAFVVIVAGPAGASKSYAKRAA